MTEFGMIRFWPNLVYYNMTEFGMLDDDRIWDVVELTEFDKVYKLTEFDQNVADRICFMTEFGQSNLW